MFQQSLSIRFPFWINSYINILTLTQICEPWNICGERLPDFAVDNGDLFLIWINPIIGIRKSNPIKNRLETEKSDQGEKCF
jgi:hypothetical protein